MHTIQTTDLIRYRRFLEEQEKSGATVEKYCRNVERFRWWLPEGAGVEKSTVIRYKAGLMQQLSPAGVNTHLAALNGFFRFMQWEDCIVKPLQIQRQIFSPPEKEITREEYMRLVEAAREKSDNRLFLLLQLMASTGIRVSEIPHVTVEALRQGVVEIRLKGKIRTILLSSSICQQLEDYRVMNGIDSGPVFRSRYGNTMSRKDIWAQMKRLCRKAGVEESKVFPHNLRHLFARSFYREQKDIAKLADILGHSSLETTRVYLVSSGQEHRRILEQMHLTYEK